MYKITRVEELTTRPVENMAQRITEYTDAELQENEFLVHIEYFKYPDEVAPCIAYLHIGSLIEQKKHKQTVRYY
jgi:hypothetical protein